MMDALWALAARLWQPWFALAVIGVGVIVTLGTGLVQLRGFVRALHDGFIARREAGAGSSVAASIAGASGIASLGAGVLAIEIGGRGALLWMWIVVLLAMALRFAEASLLEPRVPGGRAIEAAGEPVTVAPGLRRAWWLAALVAATATVGVLQGREAGALFEQGWGMAPLTAAIALAVAALPFVLLPDARRMLLASVPFALVATAVALGVLVAADELVLSFALGDAYNAAFGAGPAAAGTIAGGVVVAIAEGTRAASISAGVLQGGAVREHRWASMLAPLVGVGVISTLGALVSMTEPERASIVEKDLVPMERPHSRGLRPAAPPFGQTVVLPTDTTLQAGEHYGFVVRGNPRGINFAKLDPQRNAVLVPGWVVSDDAHEVVFRSKDKTLANLGSWDVRVPCNREVISNRGGSLVVLTPVNPELKFSQLIAYYELDNKPYVPLGDFHFVGKVALAQSNDATIGEHLAMFEAEDADRPFAPDLHEFFRTGFRGPYADDGEARPPWGFVGVAGYTAELGTRVDLRLPASPRGEPFVRLDRVGGAEAPAWNFLMGARELVVQHETDPDLDIVLPIDTELDGFRVRLRPHDPEWTDFRKLANMAGYKKVPFVRVPDQDFAAEVHGDVRLEPRYAGRVSLVPLFELGEPQGPHGEFLPYAPHPAELVANGMHGPVLARDGAALVGGRLHDGAPEWSRWLAALGLLLLGVASIAAWPMLLHRDVGQQRVIGIAIAAAVVSGGLCTWSVAYGIASIGSALAVLCGSIAVLGRLGGIRRLKD